MSRKNKAFLITIDTEGDNQWDTSKGISTANTAYLPRFQELCERYGFRPVWLTNYEMACDEAFVRYMRPKQDAGLCEIGMHLHAWYTPPEYDLPASTDQRAYLIEYPDEVMAQKIATLTDLIEQQFGIRPVSHRSGRWAMDKRYFSLLEQHGYQVDCSVTPHVDWRALPGQTGLPGTDYSAYPEKAHRIGSLLEVPMTIRPMHVIDPGRIKGPKNILGEAVRFVQGREQWLRPGRELSFAPISRLMDKVDREGADYQMFMIHSSELMTGGSPNFPTEASIDRLYGVIERIFQKAKDLGYQGMTLRAYGKEWTAHADQE